ncbi:isoprenylcysteine carboxylmethyltransferase family protein [Roseimaritima ulvae]|uniref:Isoprenylcysteine carboxyl methyltransferase (ICMT) family protein n=1 Tax=Roseimaritima ulvae TaxID=980254 RepID=A0A5B9QSR9_9BACT|nr:isoprenylcysteine carboxylmethyltransferase family protein [Roseimaritima ulvae]QEG42044.1 Isoprenylcysteine carboxyl methyltransferase (ICMT) family protein [Roseimaritima ulvae]
MKAREIAAHAVHLMVLLLPTWLWVGLHGCDAWVFSFAGIVLLAAMLESRSVAVGSDSQPAQTQDPQAMRLAQLVGFALLLLFWCIQVEHHLAGLAMPWLQITGGLLLTLGTLLRVTAIRTLGTDFVTDIRAPAVRRAEGIYRWLAHPSELGLLLIIAGAPLLLAAPRCLLVACLFFVPTSLHRIRRENQVLNTSVA